MSNENYVVVFPSIFAENKISLLIANIKKILKIKNQNYSKISRDGNLILVDANDPVFASTTINLLFGIKQVIIAKKIKNDFATVVNEINKILGNYEHTLSTSIVSNVYGGNDKDINNVIQSMNKNEVDVIMFLNSNPVYTLPNSDAFITGMKQVSTKISFSESLDETAILCDIVCPNTNYLESWGATGYP